MRSRFFLLAALSIPISACTNDAELEEHFEYRPIVTLPDGFAQPRPKAEQEEEDRVVDSAVQKPACGFSNLEFPSDFAVFAAGAYSGRKLSFRIDESRHRATQIDVAVNSPSKPVALMLGAYEPTIWNIGWSEGTEILAVLVSGYHRQVVAGLAEDVPQINSSYDNRGPCGYFYVNTKDLSALNPMATRVFGRTIEMVFPAERGQVVVGDPLLHNTELITAPEVPPESFYDNNAPSRTFPGWNR